MSSRRTVLGTFSPRSMATSPHTADQTFGLEMGHPIQSTAEMYKTPDAPETRLAVTPEEEADLRQLNAFDIGLVQIFAQHWDRIAADLEAYL
jgi:hypothetical protein